MVVVQGQALQRTRHAEARIGIDDVDADSVRSQLANHGGHIAVTTDVTGVDADLGALRTQRVLQRLETFAPTRQQRHPIAAARMLASEPLANSR